tara:strand:+ start:1735 stop:2814 length:1080 start_codon:yes stop_codon:yes gene_type:complete
MSFIFSGAAIAAGAGAIAAKETATWKDRAKARRQAIKLTGEDPGLGLFSSDDLKRNIGGDLGMIPVAGDFAQKAFEDATFDEYENGIPRNTGTWAGAGIGAAMDIAKLATMGQDFGAGEAVTEVAGEAAKGALESTIPEVLAETAGGIAANAPEAAAGATESFNNFLADYAAATKDMVAGPVGQIQDAMAPVTDAIGGVKDTLRQPFTDTLGEGLGNAAFNTAGRLVTKPAIGAMMNPDNPGEGAAQGAFSAAAGSLLDVGLDTGIGTMMPGRDQYGGQDIMGPVMNEGAFSNQPMGDALRDVTNTAVRSAAAPVVGMGQSAIQKALATPTLPQPSRNPYNPQGGLWNSPYGLHTRRRY